MPRKLMIVVVVVVAALGVGTAQAEARAYSQDPPRFSNPTKIDNRYLPLTKFDRCVLRGHEDGATVKVVRRLHSRTMPFRVEGRTVRVAVIEDEAFEDGELVERTFDYFGQGDNGFVYYFGEDVNNYEDGKLVDHEGSFRYGRETNVLGIAMPADPQVGDTWYFEFVPGITIERDRMDKRLDRKTVHGETYRDVIRIQEIIEPQSETEYKFYAKGVGNIRELPPDGKVDLDDCRRA